MELEFEAILQRMNSAVYGHYVEVPYSITKAFLAINQKRVVAVFNEIETTHTALIAHSDGFHFINVNQSIHKKIGATLGKSLHIKLNEDTSDYGIVVPIEFEELIYQDSEGDRYFHQLTPGKQRSLIYIIAKPKSSELRITKAVIILNYLKSSQGKLDFKELNEALKKK